MLEVSNLSKIFPDKKLFTNVNLKFLPGNVYGIIGANGVGKSTFLKILSGEIEASGGDIIKEKNARISSLSQNQNEFDSFIVTDAVIMGNQELYNINIEKNKIYENPDATIEDYERASVLEQKYGEMGGWNAENDAQTLLANLGIHKSRWNLKVKELKAPEKVKVLLAKALFGNPDILILDEPTNRLDLKAIKWLENFLIDYEHIVIVVSHDSKFLDEICTHIIDIDYSEAKQFVGNYTFWKQASALLIEMQQKQNLKKEQQAEKLKEFIARFSANLSKSRQATSRKKLLDKLVIDEIKPSSRKYPFIKFDLNRLPGKQVLTVQNLSYKNDQGEILFENVSFTLKPGDKMAIIGEDDIAKTKFLEIIFGKLKPTSGTVEWGITIKPNYFPNNNLEFFQNDETILEWISKWPLNNSTQETKDNSDSRMRGFLGRMLFSNDSVFKQVKYTSGGEKVRLMFSKLMLEESNFLIFDQPLDHLDSESIDSLIDAIKDYKSSCLFTTYNQTMIKECSNVILEIKPKESFLFYGDLEEYEKAMGY
ncbi:ABC-F family ATP-binding cassette domain-containing protein [Metamycoplasma hyosynoviae]|uniref:ABC-F family ATP-binding cassette domain-containing protein n=1 Tax=Metamycoplasma hyosynoviae TaxID=29559 RepID=UPI002359F3DA|nr:ABC-F family ATP-binding cassette domain-containing protein [Metamycoplasma hyosynoviae]MDC8920149.1 ABC-F family ATP-binding cassette domain-containing protein [Metamycoplasma hyosynoviae]MDD7848154.1 ABC-F family ATP-binding cassette domain-containing protein [Metamycoplasma hyosynoviae]MDD7895781.1 ABC-F family ATP-binding cassette domain-containing protein [Metamycoplasma hyosynoviae]